MQTSKIIIGEHYAVKYSGTVVRLKVTEIVTLTTRTHKKGSPSDTVNTIKGLIEAADLPPGRQDSETSLHSVSPEDVMGHYTEFAELKAKQEEADRIRKETQAHEEAVQARLQAKLYEITGLAAPATGRSYHDPFNSEYTNSIRINGHETIEKLLEVLESVEWATTSATAR
jgi:hypothetical protein